MNRFFYKEEFSIIQNQEGILKSKKGITLIALIVTIVIMLIIAGIGITFIVGENGILNKAQNAKQEHTKAEAVEQLKVKLSEYIVNNQGVSDLKQLDGISIDGYQANLTSIGRVISLTKGDETFSYLIDEKYNIIPLSNVMNGNTQGSNISQLDFQPDLSNNGDGSFHISVPSDVISSMNVAGYIYIADGKLIENSTNSGINIQGSNVNVQIMVIDFNGTTRTSKEIYIENPILNFDYTGNLQIAALSSGKYKLEIWGAQGGNDTAGTQGGRGGYSKGEITITSEQIIYVYVGGQGAISTYQNGVGSAGGWNGGGTGGYGSGGGGASDIRVGGKNLSNRIIVAGGGGGSAGWSSTSYIGGAGGGTAGLKGTGNGSYSPAYGGTQTSGGSSGNYSTTQPGSLGQGAASVAGSGGGAGGRRLLWWRCWCSFRWWRRFTDILAPFKMLLLQMEIK